jgi:hypothetical protein
MSYPLGELPKAKVLITVKTYPLPSSDHGEVVCTAGLLDGKKWVRMYPISSNMYDDKKYPKYSWVELDLIKHPHDFRLESYMPRNGLDEPIRFIERIGTDDYWAARKEYVYSEVFTSMDDLISLSKSENRSLATLKPLKIIDFIIEETERDWKPQWREKLSQLRMFDLNDDGKTKPRRIISKVPYIFKYKFLSEGDSKPRVLSIHDWEIGTLFWNCLRQSDGDEENAKVLVRQKYFDEFVSQKDLLLFLGTTYEFHKRRVDNPFIIIGVFYPPKTQQLSLFSPNINNID